MRRGFAVALGTAAIAALAAFAWPAHQPAPAPAAAPAVTQPAALLPRAIAAVPVPPPAADHRAELELPDGTFVPSLNGAVGARPIATAWGSQPWSPIVATERSDRGVDWYVHADGSRSTTEMQFRSDLARLDALTRVAHPGPKPGPAGLR
jgi:hypothetical protein